ncbi:hypothetical protein FG386_003151 [Cryptosporidium ryanae]|uniref:uncharacterized protein n=1 Tax=Cryptosporidium ryanae TaxID=515981 RepID=UPI00351A585C|nr:hypothetical protein FG386_003151 [Cryptosporidium ryanae]
MEEELIVNEIKNLKHSKSELSAFFEVLNKNELIDLEITEVIEMVDLIVKKNEDTRIIIFLILVNRLKMIYDKIKLFKSDIKNNMNKKNSKVITEFVFLSEYMKNGNAVNDLFNYYITISREDSNSCKDELIFQLLSNLFKVPFFSMNIIVETFSNSKHNVSPFILEEHIPFELQENNFFNYLWISTLDTINKKNINIDCDSKCINFLRYFFKRMFTRGYCKNLCVLFTDIINGNTYYSFKEIEFDIKRVFLNVIKILTHIDDKKITERFILQLLNQIEEKNITVISERITIVDLPDKSLTLNLLSAITDYCIINNNEICIQTLFKEKLSLNLCISFLDISLLNISNKSQVDKITFLKGEFDYIIFFKANMEKGENHNCGMLDLFCEKFIDYFEFYKKTLETLLKQWELNDDSEKNSYTLSVLIIKLISIVLFIKASTNEFDKTVSELLSSHYIFVSNGIQARLKSIDPIVRYSSMYLGEFYFNVLTLLFPSNEQFNENNGYLTTEETPKFEELNCLNDSIKRRYLYHLKHSTNTIIVSSRNIDEKTVSIVNGGLLDENAKAKDGLEEDNNQLFVKKLDSSKGKHVIHDSDDVFWDNAPNIKKKDSLKSSQISCSKLSQNDNLKPQSKVVIKSFELITFYTDDKKSSQILDKEEILLQVLNDLLLNIKEDTSDYDYIIIPLIDKLISFNEKELRYTSLLVISKIIELKTELITTHIIGYACNINNSIPMDTKILLLNSLILACRNLSNYRENNHENNSKHTTSYSFNGKKNKSAINLFDKYSLIWSSNLVKYLIDIIKQSQQVQYEKIPNIFFITSLELFNNIILNTSVNNVHTNQIYTFGLEIIFGINTKENSLFQDPTIRKSLYLLSFNIMQKCNNSLKRDTCAKSIVNEIINWFINNEIYERDDSCIEIIKQIKNCVIFY